MSLIESFKKAKYVIDTIGVSKALDTITGSTHHKYDQYTDDLVSELCDHYKDVKMIAKYSDKYDIALYYNGYLYLLWIANIWCGFIHRYTIIKCTEQQIEQQSHWFYMECDDGVETVEVDDVRPSLYNKVRFYNCFAKQWLDAGRKSEVLKQQRIKFGALNSFNQEF